MPDPAPTSAAAADSPHLAQLRSREKMLKHKIAHRIPKFSDRKEEALGRAKSALSDVQRQIREAEGTKAKSAKTPRS